MKKVVLLVCLIGTLVGCTRHEKSGAARFPETVNDPSGSGKPTLSAPGSTNIGTARPQSYESTTTPLKPGNTNTNR